MKRGLIKSNWLALSILIIHLALGILYSVAVPIWEAYDEWGHYEFVRYMASECRFPKTRLFEYNDETHQPPLYYILGALATFWIDTTDGLEPIPNLYTITSTTEGGANMALHSRDMEAFPYHGTVLAIHVTRLLSVFLSMVVVWATYLMGCALFPRRKEIALGAMAVNAFWPQFLFNGSMVTNDIMVTACSSLVLLFLLRILFRKRRGLDIFVLGLCIGGGLMSKRNGLALLPLALAGVTYVTIKEVREGKISVAFLDWALFLAGMSLVSAWWYQGLLRSYGGPLQSVASILGTGVGRLRSRIPGNYRGLSSPLIAFEEKFHWDTLPDALHWAFVTFWACFGWGNIAIEPWIYNFVALVYLVSCLGLAAFLGRKSKRSVRLGIAVPILHLILLVSAPVYQTLLTGIVGSLQGRFFLPGISSVSFLLFLGLANLWPDRFVKGLVALIALAMLVFAVIIPFRYILPAYAKPGILSYKDDIRSIADYLESVVDSDSIIVFDYVDYAFHHYYCGQGEVYYIQPVNHKSQSYPPGLQREFWDWEEPQQIAAQLEELRRGKERIAIVKWSGGGLDQGDLMPFLLELNGELVGQLIRNHLRAQIYELRGPITFPNFQPAYADYGTLRLIGAFYQPTVPADEAIGLALRWKLDRSTDKEYKVTAILQDKQGRHLSGADAFLRWKGGEATTYHLVPIPLGTPPLSYRITVGVYDDTTMQRLSFLDAAGNPTGTDFPLGEVKLTRAERFDRDLYDTAVAFHFQPVSKPEIAEGLALEGFHLYGKEVRPGEKMDIVLKWRLLKGDLSDYIPCLRLKQDGIIIAESENAPADGRYPTSLWRKGEIVLDRCTLLIPPQAGEGKATLEIEVDGKVLPLAQLEIAASERTFTVPDMQHELRVQFGDFAELIGYDLDQTEVTAEGKVKLTLYWQAIGKEPIETSYKVFAHLLNEEKRLIGQHDGFPASGTRPTTSWTEGEIIVDVHEMEFREPYQGEAIIEVGMYDPKTGERLSAFDSEGKRLPNDRVLLETAVTVR